VELELYSCGDETVPMCSRGTVQFCLQSISVTWFFARNLAGLVGGATKAPYSQRFCDLAGSLSYSLSVQFASDWSILITNSPRSPSKSCLTDRHTGRHVRHCMYPVGQARIRVCVGRWTTIQVTKCHQNEKHHHVFRTHYSRLGDLQSQVDRSALFGSVKRLTTHL
jgi:hypothetical protein